MSVHLSTLKLRGSNSVLHSVSSSYLNFSKLLLAFSPVGRLHPAAVSSAVKTWCGQSLNFLIFVFKGIIWAFKYKSPFRNGFCVYFQSHLNSFSPTFC